MTDWDCYFYMKLSFRVGLVCLGKELGDGLKNEELGFLGAYF